MIKNIDLSSSVYYSIIHPFI